MFRISENLAAVACLTAGIGTAVVAAVYRGSGSNAKLATIAGISVMSAVAAAYTLTTSSSAILENDENDASNEDVVSDSDLKCNEADGGQAIQQVEPETKTEKKSTKKGLKGGFFNKKKRKKKVQTRLWHSLIDTKRYRFQNQCSQTFHALQHQNRRP